MITVDKICGKLNLSQTQNRNWEYFHTYYYDSDKFNASGDVTYQLEYLKSELQRKENCECPINRVLITIIAQLLATEEQAARKTIFEKLEMLHKQDPKNIFVLGLLGFCSLRKIGVNGPVQNPLSFISRALSINREFVFANHNLGYFYNRISSEPRRPTMPTRASIPKAGKGMSISTSSSKPITLEDILRRNDDEAEEYLKKAAVLGYIPAQYELTHLMDGLELGVAHSNTIINESDSKQLEKNLKEFAEAGYTPAAKELEARGIPCEDTIYIAAKVQTVQDTLRMFSLDLWGVTCAYLGWSFKVKSEASKSGPVKPKVFQSYPAY
jgi:hypothetical protein